MKNEENISTDENLEKLFNEINDLNIENDVNNSLPLKNENNIINKAINDIDELALEINNDISKNNHNIIKEGINEKFNNTKNIKKKNLNNNFKGEEQLIIEKDSEIEDDNLILSEDDNINLLFKSLNLNEIEEEKVKNKENKSDSYFKLPLNERIKIKKNIINEPPKAKKRKYLYPKDSSFEESERSKSESFEKKKANKY